MPRLLTCGIVTWDWLYRVDRIPTGPGEVPVQDFLGTGGGMAASAACAIGRLGGQVEFWGRCGNDAVGDDILADMRRYGVRVDRVRRIPGHASPVSAILIDRRGERLIVPYYDPALDQDPSWLPIDEVGRFAGVMVDVRWPSGAARALAAARAAGAIAMLDADLAPRPVLDDLMACATHAVWSEVALRDWSGQADPRAGLRAARCAFAGFLGVTIGADGFLWLDGEAVREVPAPRVAAVDTLAAGDVFHGAFLLALAEGQDIAAAARFANAAAALKCAGFGSRTTTPTRAEVETVLATWPG
jgi:sugar/nucleoside kinase (ribokinase family)